MENTNENILKYNGCKYYMLEVAILERNESESFACTYECPFKAYFVAVDNADYLDEIFWDKSTNSSIPVSVCRDVAGTILRAFETRSPVIVSLGSAAWTDGLAVTEALCFNDCMNKENEGE